MSRKIGRLMVLVLFMVLIGLGLGDNFQTCQINTSRERSKFDLDAFLGFKTSQITPIFNLSKYTNLNGSQILIDERNPDFNWSKTAADNDWCSGSGTWSDPYVIENVLIDGEFNFTEIDTYPICPLTKNCISIYYSTAYFIVQNCFLTRSGIAAQSGPNSGILLYESENGVITNSVISYCTEGVSIENSDNITVDFNIIFNNIILYGDSKGIHNEYGNNSTLTRNLIFDTGMGITLFRTNDNNVEKNLLNNSLYDHPATGIHIRQVNTSEIVNNVLAGDFSRISVFYINSTGSQENVIYDNTIQGTLPTLDVPSLGTSGTFNALVSLEESHHNTIAHNVLYIPGYNAGESIAGYDLFALLVSLSLSIFVISMVIIISKKKFKPFF